MLKQFLFLLVLLCSWKQAAQAVVEIRNKISPTYSIRTIAGGGYDSNSLILSNALNAQLKSPYFIEFGDNDELFISDSDNHCIRKLYPNSTLETIAGSCGSLGYSDGASVTTARLNNPKGLAYRNGILYFADADNFAIRKLSNGIITTLIQENGKLLGMNGILFSNNQLYICATYEARIYIYYEAFNFLDVHAGRGSYGHEDGPGTSAAFGANFDLVEDGSNQFYISDSRYVRNMYSSMVYTYAGKDAYIGGVEQDGYDKMETYFDLMYGITRDNSNGDLFVSQIDSRQSIRKIDGTSNNVSTIIGGNGRGSYGDGGPANQAQLNFPIAIKMKQSDKSIYIVDSGNGRIRQTKLDYCPSTHSYDPVSKLCLPKCYGKANGDPNICSSHGICIDINNCTCQIGYYGNECQNFDCSISDNLCLNGGLCSVPGSCTCLNGQFGGEACQFPICFGILSNISNVCSTHGQCQGPNSCQCNEHWYGPQCNITSCYGIYSNQSNVCYGNGNCQDYNKCKCYNSNDWSGSECILPVCNGTVSTSSQVCNEHGNCSSPHVCSCQYGYSGQFCQFKNCFDIPENDPNVCSNQGLCTDINSCTCTNSSWGGINCNISQCDFKLSTDVSVCSGHGQCLDGICSCQTIYGGPFCNISKCNGKLPTDYNVCNQHGSCNSNGNCECNENYGGIDCEIAKCNNTLANETSLVCNGNGECLEPNICNCSSTHGGQFCQFITCFDILSNETLVCSNGQGICTQYNTCKCRNGYSGLECEYSTCYNLNSTNENVCSGNGNCTSPNNCTCYENYFGNECELTSCYGIFSNESKVCHSRGKCLQYNYCNCNENYDGLECDNFSCFGTERNSSLVCHSNGVCKDYNTCQCNNDFLGSECELVFVTELNFTINNTLQYINEESTSEILLNIYQENFERVYFNRNVTVLLIYELNGIEISRMNLTLYNSNSIIIRTLKFTQAGNCSISLQLFDWLIGVQISNKISQQLTLISRPQLSLVEQSIPKQPATSKSVSITQNSTLTERINGNTGLTSGELVAAIVTPILAVSLIGISAIAIVVTVVIVLKKKAANASLFQAKHFNTELEEGF